VSTVLKFRGREISGEDVHFICALIAKHPRASRRALSLLLCEAWNWRQPNGVLRDMVCRSLMLQLHRADHIKLPPARKRAPGPGTSRRVKQHQEMPFVSDGAITELLPQLRPLEIRQVRRTGDERLFDSLINEHHYLGYTRPVGEHLKFIAFSRARPIACFAWGSAPRHLGPRDRFIGWTPQARRRNVNMIAINTRFLILPWVQVPHLASHLLAQMARTLASEWERVYCHPIVYLETFVDPARFKGTCYRAANWISLGLTTGRGHNAPTKARTQPKKEVLGYPLAKNFRTILSETP
jgi:hypothetical protein